MAFALLSFILPEKTILFMGLTAASICLFEQVFHKLSLISLLTLAFMSSTMQYLTGIFSFPLRLSLTKVAAGILDFSCTRSLCEGNVIIFGQREYSVDPACMGLKMLLTSLLCGLFIIAILQKKQARYLKWHGVLLSLGAIFMLNMVANIIRILFLVYFDVNPENTMHEIIGLLCLAFYVMAPGLLIISLFVRRLGRERALRDDDHQVCTIDPMRVVLAHILLLMGLMTSIYIRHSIGHAKKATLPEISGYSAAWYNSEVIQYNDANSLIYIKQINGVLGGEHNPVTCWLGLGYQFEKMSETTLANNRIYTGILKKGQEILYSAWWYDNGVDKTTSFFGWRWSVLKGKRPYSIVNITTANQALLNEKVKEVIENNTFRQILEKP
jgi:exosortase N